MHEVRTFRADEEGRGIPGPPLARGRVAAALPALAAAWALLAASAMGRFTLETVTVGRAQPYAVAGLSALASALLLALVHLPEKPSSRAGDRSDLGARMTHPEVWTTAALSAIASGVAPALMLTARHSDAPAGSVVAFWWLALAGATLAATSALGRGPRGTRLAGTLTALVGAAGVLANLERPSSFSLFSRYVPEQLTIMFAAALWAASVALLAARARSRGWSLVAPAAVLGAAVAGAFLIALEWDTLTTLPLAAWGAAALAAVTVVLALSLSASRGPEVAGTAVLAGPAMLLLLSELEALLGVRGPLPILLVPASWGVAVTGVGIAVTLWRTKSGVGPVYARSSRGIALASGAALVGVLAAVGGLLAPGLDVAVRGTTAAGGRFAADFQMSGYETVGGWLVLAAAALALATVYGRTRGASALTVPAAAIAALAWWNSGFTALHTWIPWIPAEVQQDYGTEYASLVFKGLPVPWQIAALVLTGAAFALAIGSGALATGKGDAAPEHAASEGTGR